MTRFIQVFFLFLCFALVFSSCNEGIQAPPEGSAGFTPGATGFSGVITYKNWPPADSLVDLRLVAFKSFPPGDIFTQISNGEAVVFPPDFTGPGLPINVDTTHYFAHSPQGRYQYIVVAQRYGSSILAWRAVGQYDLDNDLTVPSAIQVPADGSIDNVNINVDFKHLPPQPF